MTIETFLLTYGPHVILGVVSLLGFVRMQILARRDAIFVFAALRQKKTPTEHALGVIAVVIYLYIVARPFVPILDSLVYAQPSPVPLIGLGLMGGGVGLVVLCWFNMGSSWRIGVPVEKETSQSLVTSGLYQYSRNPIYVGIMAFLIGICIFVPGPLPLLAAIATFFLKGNTIRQEEAFLKGAFGDQYDAYCSQVRRWI